ncbi:hypothetical protein SBV1_960046 [Verrucomicrobia bacterium]|nr:hypothetical protein SBV1_960046 [Verrucomicrobiota bacterium]
MTRILPPRNHSFSEASEKGQSEQPNLEHLGEGSYDPGMNHQRNWASRRGRGSGMLVK